jgi:Domain of unknown function (DUF4838)
MFRGSGMTKRLPLLFLLVMGLCLSSKGAFVLSEAGKPKVTVIVQEGATDPEAHSATELADILSRVTGGKVATTQSSEATNHPCIVVGQGTIASALFPEIDFSRLGPEEFAIKTKGKYLLLAGGRPRGTMYAVNRFLQEQCRVRWWTPWATNIPSRPNLRIPALDVREKPAFEYRGPFWSVGFDPAWKAHNCVNNENQLIPKKLGGSVTYKGFCHTFYPLVPPDKYFAEHPEWYSLVKGKRTHNRAQLCLTNPQLRDFMVQRVKEWLRESPDASIISVTQNDWDGHCECPDCKALDDAEGSHSGTMLAFVNYIAEKIESEFPNVAVDTFAYQYTRKPPKTLKPRHNVIVRLCSIECNFREPLDHPSNASFLADLEQWSKISDRLYIWDYVTDFSHYIFPYPNWFTMGANMRIFQKSHVQGIFEEGAYGGPGAEMAELRAWVLAQLMWNPQQNDEALIQEFLDGYYGKAGKPIRKYMDLMYSRSKGFYLGCFLRKAPPHFKFEAMAAAEALWEEAEQSVASNPELLQRVRMAHLPIRAVWLNYWPTLRHDCWEKNLSWPLPDSRKAVADEWREVARGIPGKDWTVVHHMNESGQTVEQFLEAHGQDLKTDYRTNPPARLSKAPAPTDIPGINRTQCIDLQDNKAHLYKPGEFAEIQPDLGASDRRAVWMPGSHKEWAFRISGSELPKKAYLGKWKVYAVVRVEKCAQPAGGSSVFTAGVYDVKTKAYPANLNIPVAEASETYHSFLLGTVEFNADRDIWIAPSANKAIKAVYVDRVYLVPAS